MTGITLVINGQDMAPVLTGYEVTHSDEVDTELTTMDGRRHRFGVRTRTTVLFSTLPSADGVQTDHRVLRSGALTVRFSDPDYGSTRTMECRLISDRKARFLLHNVFGDDIYKHDSYALECVEVDNASNI